MAIMSVFQGYYALNVYKAYGYTKDILNDDLFLAKVGSIASFMGALRFVWSAAMDRPWASFKLVYGTLLVLETILGSTIWFAAQARWTYSIWLCLMRMKIYKTRSTGFVS